MDDGCYRPSSIVHRPSSIVYRLSSIVYRLLRKREIKGRALGHLALGPHSTAVPVNDALHYGKPHSRAFKFLRRVQPLEDPEDLAHEAHIKARAVVFHV